MVALFLEPYSGIKSIVCVNRHQTARPRVRCQSPSDRASSLPMVPHAASHRDRQPTYVPDAVPVNTCCVVRIGRRARVADSTRTMAAHLDTVAHEYGVQLRKHAYEDQQARRRRSLRLGRAMTESQHIQADHEASLDIQITRLSRLARAENVGKGLSRISEPETESLGALQLELAEMFTTTFERPPGSVMSLQRMSSSRRRGLRNPSNTGASRVSTRSHTSMDDQRSASIS